MRVFSVWQLVLALALLGAGCTPSPHDLIGLNEIEALARQLEANPQLVEARTERGKTPLHFAVTYKRPKAMALLLEAGADINARDVTGMTPLHVAAMLGRKDEAEWLLARGADATARDDFGDTPLHTAALFGNGHLLRLLHTHGLDYDSKNAAGKTPAELAAEQGHERVVAYIEHLTRQD